MRIKFFIQVHIPGRRSSKSFVFKMKCQLTSSTTHEVMISKEIKVPSYKDICGGEPRKMNLGYNNQKESWIIRVENNTLFHFHPSNISSEIQLICLTTGKFWRNSSLFTTLKLIGWTVK